MNQPQISQILLPIFLSKGKLFDMNFDERNIETWQRLTLDFDVFLGFDTLSYSIPILIFLFYPIAFHSYPHNLYEKYLIQEVYKWSRYLAQLYSFAP